MERLLEEIDRIVERRRGEAIRLLRELIRTPSLSGEEGEVALIVGEHLRAAGLKVEVLEAEARQRSQAVLPYPGRVWGYSARSGTILHTRTEQDDAAHSREPPQVQAAPRPHGRGCPLL